MQNKKNNGAGQKMSGGLGDFGQGQVQKGVFVQKTWAGGKKQKLRWGKQYVAKVRARLKTGATWDKAVDKRGQV